MGTKQAIIPADRQQKIISYIKENGSAKIKALADYLHVSEATIRRDLDELDADGQVLRTHGGAILRSENAASYERQHNERMTLYKEEKRRIARMAASLVHDGEVILLDSGTTNYYLAEELAGLQNLTVITYDLFIAYNMTLHPTSNLIVTGGFRRQGYRNVLLGSVVEDFIRNIRVDKAFLGADAIDPDFGISNTNLSESSIKKLLINAGKEVIMVADHSKFNKQALVRVCGLREIDRIITGRDIDPETERQLHEKIKNVYLV